MIITPSPEQQAILDLGLTSIKVRAGAGTGKTTTVALVIANLIDNHGVDPEQILGITFTNKAASELADRVSRELGENPASQPEVHTYHGFAAQVLAEFGALARVDSRVRIITPTFARQLIHENYIRSTFQHLNITWNRSLGPVIQFGDRLSDHLLEPGDILALPITDEVGEERAEMASVLDRYNQDKRELGVVDYSDLVTLSTRIVRDHPDLAGIIRSRYRVIVLDEYQDTNPAQRTLLRAIFTDGFPTIAVGDEDQTIYEWRGASAENFEQFAEHFPTPDGQPAHLRGLTINRRSTQPILDVANDVRAVANDEAEPLVSATDDSSDTEILTYWAGDAIQEAEWIASQFERLHDQGIPWSEMAVLFRKNRHFQVVVDTLSRHDIPVEVANVGGLLAVPEVAELIAWLRLIEYPEDSTALTQILFGSRYRLGMADLLPLVRSTPRKRRQDPDEPDPITLVETIEAGLGNIVDQLRPDARIALDHFGSVYRRVLVESQGLALVDICRLVLDLTGAWRDVEALPTNARLTARLNLYRMLDLAEDWSPLRGKPSTHAFLDYLQTMDEDTGEDIDAARISGADAVTLVTVHRAKGLEWDNVAIPAVTKGNFPGGVRVLEDPVSKAEFVPRELRIDRVLDAMPSGTGTVETKARAAFFRDINRRQEWRVAYVAVTRARKRMFVSGAQWYGLPEPTKHPAEPSELWHLINDHPASTNDGIEPPVERPQLLGAGVPVPAPDPIFDDGWDNAIRMAMSEPESVPDLARRLGVSDRYTDQVETTEARLFDLGEPPGGGELEPEPVVSVTGLVTYARCPKQFYWTSVDPLPRRPNPAATRGTEVHRQIELHQRGQVPLDLVDHDLYDLPDEGPIESTGAPGPLETYLESRFATAKATMIEAPFSFDLPIGHRIRGRIDAVYTDGPKWEVVDFKSGRLKDDPTRLVQLEAYAIAATDVDFGLPKPEELVVTFAYLGGGGDEVTHQVDDVWMAGARQSIGGLVEGIARSSFEERPGDWCRGCDFLRFCGPGREYVT